MDQEKRSGVRRNLRWNSRESEKMTENQNPLTKNAEVCTSARPGLQLQTSAFCLKRPWKTCFPRGFLLPALRLRRRTRTVPHDFAFHVWKRRSGALPDTAWLLTISHCVSIWIPRLCLHVVQPALHLSYLSSFWCGSGSNLSRQSPACCLRWSQQPLVASPSTPAAARASLLSASALVR